MHGWACCHLLLLGTLEVALKRKLDRSPGLLLRSFAWHIHLCLGQVYTRTTKIGCLLTLFEKNNYESCASQIGLNLTKFIVNNINIYVSENIFYN